MNRNGKIFAIALLILLALAAGTGVVLMLSEDTAPLTEMHLEVEDNGQMYCADFVANKVEPDKIEVTIINCSDTPIALKVKNGQKGSELDANEEYSVELPAGVDEFDVNIETFEGELLGGFKL